ncbi:MAG: lanthionine synthetase C family protein [Spirosomataceae bacterium]
MNVQLLTRIYQHISSQPIEGDPSFLGGQMSYAFFEAYYQNQFGIEENSRTWERIIYSLNKIQEDRLMHSFAGGIAGISWVFLHLFNQGLLQDEELDAQSIIEDLDGPLFETSMLLLTEGNFDYLHGGLGSFLYFLERTPSLQVTNYIEQLVEQLSAVAIRFPNGDITWRFDNFGIRDPEAPVLYNLGLSHGTASIVSILSLFYEKGYARTRCQELIEGTLQWMWRVRNKSAESVFPNTVNNSPVDQESRLAWCYGDLGIANTFWLAGEKLKNNKWKEIAQQTILHSISRSESSALIFDAAFCHGSAGIAYIFRKFAQRISEPRLSEAADFWLQKTIAFALPVKASDVFLSYHNKEMVSNLSILDGEASIGMMLLSEMGISTTWDRFLLLS